MNIIILEQLANLKLMHRFESRVEHSLSATALEVAGPFRSD